MKRTRYHHQYQLPEIGKTGQAALSDAKIAVVGLGGLGCPAALYLAAAGIGKLGIIDHDLIELSNLQRQILYSEQHIGQPKVLVAAERLSGLNSSILISPEQVKLTHQNAEILLRDYDIIIDGTDNFSTKYLINDLCVLKQKTMLFAAVEGFRGMLACFTGQSACYRCLFPQRTSAAAHRCSEVGVIGALPGILGALQALEAVRVIAGISEGDKLLVLDGLSMNMQSIALKKEPQCILCGSSASLQEISVDSSVTVPQSRWISFQEAVRCTEACWIDIRSEDDFAHMHYPGSVNRPLAQFSLDAIDAKKIILCCQAGIRCQSLWEQCQSRPEIFFLKNGLAPLLNNDHD